MPPKRLHPELESWLQGTASDTAPVLLELSRRQAARRRPADLLAQLQRDGFVAPSQALDQRLAHRLDGIALEAASLFEALLLSPVAPLGSCSVLAPTSQDRTLSATRGAEVVSDPTNVLALECARRIAQAPGVDVRLCTAHQVLRAQALPAKAGHSRHFRLFALAEAGAGRAEDGFEVEAIVRHVGVWDRAFDGFTSALGCSLPRRRAVVHTTPEREVLASRLAQRVGEALPHVEVVRVPLQSRYYAGVRVLFGAHTQAGEFVALGDTGAFDWMARLLANRKLRFVASGMGVQLVPVLFAGKA